MDPSDMDALIAKLDVGKLIATIQGDVQKYVTTYLEEKLSAIASEIAKQCEQDEATVMQWIRSAVNLEASITSKKKSTAKPVENLISCSAKTKAGTPCKYKCGSGETMCKKHKKIYENLPCSSRLPLDEQAWFEEQEAYKKSFFPEYEKGDITMDDDVVDDSNVVTHE